ncbi:MAG TPA: glycosyltransferase family 4 protein [Gemmatimonadaceae bacterium]|nr:glycosyltransferase family 4 protein [Gemmatimonadaceae bacterium]
MPRLALLCEGDAESADKAFSGTAKSLLDHLRGAGLEVRSVDCELYGARKLVTAGRVYARDGRVWKTRYRLGATAFAARSARARVGVRALGPGLDAAIQIGATFAPPRGLPYFLYCDWNMRLAERFRDSGQSPALHMTSDEAAGVDRREAAVYAGATRIFTISERLRQSFIADYGIPADRVVAARAGANLDVSRIPERAPARDPAQPPTVLFVGREFERKGGDLLLDAFRAVRARVPNARLLVVGPRELPGDGARQPGVELLGPLRKDDPVEGRRLLDAYAAADVFCLPTRYEPLGIVVIEAMLFGLPCVTSDTWAMGEMVADGETGYVVPLADRPVDGLADRMVRLLESPELARRMGAAGRRRASELFSWAAAASTIAREVRAALSGRVAASAIR